MDHEIIPITYHILTYTALKNEILQSFTIY